MHNIKDFFVGDSISFEVSDDTYRARDNYTLKVILINAKLPKIELLCNTDVANDKYTLTKTNTETKEFNCGKYKMFFVYTKLVDLFSKQIDEGFLEIKTDIVNSENFDHRNEDEKKLDLINDLIDGRLVDGVDAFTVNGRSVTLMNINELMKLKKHYENKINNNLKLEELRKYGRTNRNKLKLKWSN